MTTTVQQDQQWEEQLLRLQISQKKQRIMLACIEQGYDSVELLEGDIRRRNRQKYEDEIASAEQAKIELRRLVDLRERDPQRYSEYHPTTSRNGRETFDGRTLKRYGSDGKVTETILCTTGAGLGHITAVY